MIRGFTFDILDYGSEEREFLTLVLLPVMMCSDKVAHAGFRITKVCMHALLERFLLRNLLLMDKSF